ncbi:hypothetical protein FRC19_005013 [Serendipita sp. 401]|nr:hypothetical protein FRC19_005013 [Serendipita sp. 401]
MRQTSTSPLLKPRDPPLGIEYSPRPQNWLFDSSFDPDKQSLEGSLRCLEVEIATNLEQYLVVILDIRYYASRAPSDSLVKIVIGGMGVNTMVKAAATTTTNPKGRTYLWGCLPKNLLSDRLDIALQVVAGDIVHDQIEIGILNIVGMSGFNHNITPPQAVEPSTLTLPYTDTKEHRKPDNKRKSAPKVSKKRQKRASLIEADTDPDFAGLETPPGFHQIEFILKNDLASAIRCWTPAERKKGRRLIRFRRQQTGPSVSLSFATHVDNELYEKSSSIVISCIRWPSGKQRFFVTSYDVVRLAEFTLQRTLSTEMKNRARRNMAAVPSITLPKAKDLSDEQDPLYTKTFALVMDFDNPKARSIERSIKVFDWNNLFECLSRILQRFIIPDTGEGNEAMNFEHQLDAARKWKRLKSMSTSSPRSPLNWRFTRASFRRAQILESESSDSSMDEDEDEIYSSQEPVVPPQPLVIVQEPAQIEAPLAQVPPLVVTSNPGHGSTQPHPPLLIRTSSLPQISPSSSQGNFHHGWNTNTISGSNLMIPSPTETYPPSYHSPSSVGSTSSSRNGSNLDLPDVTYQVYPPHTIQEINIPQLLTPTPAPMLAARPPTYSSLPACTLAQTEWEQDLHQIQNPHSPHFFQQRSLLPRPLHTPTFFVQRHPHVVSVDPRSLSGNMIPQGNVLSPVPSYAFTPTCVVYPLMVPIQHDNSATMQSMIVKDEPEDINPDEWLNNDFIMADEQMNKVEPS